MRHFYERNYFLIRRLHSLSGIIPVGAFFLVHMFFNSRAAQSPEQYQWVPDTLDQIPFLMVVELCGILLPILFHACLGAVIVWQGTPVSVKPAQGWYANWAYMLQRWTGVVLFVMIVWHVWEAWWPHTQLKLDNELNGTHSEFDIFNHAAGLVAADWKLIGYYLFVLLAAYHFGNGIYNFLYKWGATTSKGSQRFAIALGMAVGLVGVVMGFWSLWGLRFSAWAQETLQALVP